MRSSGVGGQAVLEGVMMKNKSDYAVAVRKPDGEISVVRGKCKSDAERPLFFRFPLIRGVVAFVDSLVLGMRTLTYSASFYEEEESEKKRSKDEPKQELREQIEMVLTVLLAIVLAVAVFMLLPFFLSQLLQDRIQSQSLLALIEGVIRIVLFVGYVYAISFMGDIRRVFMYHGAEHKSINCIENGLELTVGNVRRQSKHHRRCGTSFLLIVMFISILFFMFIHFENIWLRMFSRILLVPVVAGISYEFIRLAGNSDSKIVAILSKPGMLLQRLTTKEPDDKMVEVAIASVEEVFDWKEYQRRCIAEEKRQAERKKKMTTDGKKKKSRAQAAEELRQREREYAKRANERARRLKEQEQREAELERIADEATRRKAKRQAMLQNKLEDDTDDGLEGLDHFFDTEDKAEQKDGTDVRKES